MSRVAPSVVRARYRLWLAALAALLLAAGSFETVFAQEGPSSKVRISFKVDKDGSTVEDDVKFGDFVTFSLEVTYPEGYIVEVPTLPLDTDWGPFEIREQPVPQITINDDGTQTTSRTIKAVVFGTGELQTPDLPISVRDPEGRAELVSPFPVQLTVDSSRSVNESSGQLDAEPKDIRGQASFSTPIWENPVAQTSTLLIVLGGLLVGAVIAVYLIRRRLQGPPPPVLDTRTPWEIAIAELDRIERLDMPEEGRFKEHYTLVADTMRVYIQAMYLREVSPFDAIDMTTDEIRAALERSSLNDHDAGLVLDLLRDADVVKFAKYTPSVSQAYEDSGQARYIVEITRPASEPGEVSENAAYANREAKAELTRPASEPNEVSENAAYANREAKAELTRPVSEPDEVSENAAYADQEAKP